MLSILFSGAFMLVSAVMWFASYSVPGASEWDIIGSRAIPQVMIAGMGICSLIVFVQSVLAWKQKGFSTEGLSAVSRYVPVFVIFAAIFVWLLLAGYLGFFTSSLLFLLFLHWYLNGCRLSLVGVISSAVTLALLYGIFVKLLKVLLPEGLFI